MKEEVREDINEEERLYKKIAEIYIKYKNTTTAKEVKNTLKKEGSLPEWIKGELWKFYTKNFKDEKDLDTAFNDGGSPNLPSIKKNI